MGYLEQIVARTRATPSMASAPNQPLASPLADHDQRLHDVAVDVPLSYEASELPEEQQAPPPVTAVPRRPHRARVAVADVAPAQAAPPVPRPPATHEPMARLDPPPAAPVGAPAVIRSARPHRAALTSEPPSVVSSMDRPPPRVETSSTPMTNEPARGGPRPVAAPVVPRPAPARGHRDPMQALLSALNSAEAWVRSPPKDRRNRVDRADEAEPLPPPRATSPVVPNLERGPSTSPLSSEPEPIPVKTRQAPTIRIGAVHVEVVAPPPKRNVRKPSRREPPAPIPAPLPFGWRQR